MATINVDITRLNKLSKLFYDVINNRRELSTSRDGKLFIQSICAQADPATCVHKLLSGPVGLSSLQKSMRFDTSTSFLNEDGRLILEYFRSPTLASIDSGSVLSQLLTAIVEPPFFWDAYTKAFVGSILNPSACETYAWLLLQLIRIQNKQTSPYVRLLSCTPEILESILKSPSTATRNLGQKIKHSLPLELSELHVDAEAKPGGRHNNDHADFRQISIMPTADELFSKETPFFRTTEYLEDPVRAAHRSALHMDNQFRLLREDMLREIRGEIQLLTGEKSGRHKGMIIGDLKAITVDVGEEKKRHPWSIVFQCNGVLPQVRNMAPASRRSFLKDNRQILRHGNMSCLILDNEPVAFPTIHRDEEKLSADPATFSLQFPNDSTLTYALSKLKHADKVKVAQLDTATFGFEPFLQRLQDMSDLPLKEEILHWLEGNAIEEPTFTPLKVIQNLKANTGKDLKSVLGTKTKVTLDKSQMASLEASLSQRVSLVQGPPGTGKSFIGALVAKIIHDSTKEVILVECFTNHALDQFLEDLMDIGIPAEHMVRLGGKSTDRTKPLTLRNQTSATLSPLQWASIGKLKGRLEDHQTRLQDSFGRYLAVNPTKKHLMEYLDFEEPKFFEAFNVNTSNDGMTRVGRRGKAMDPFYLLDRWTRGVTDAGSLQHTQPKSADKIWKMPPDARKARCEEWQNAIMAEIIAEIREVGQGFDKDEAKLTSIFNERDAGVIRSKRIIACTTNGAAKYSASIQSARPGVVLVEEAGEILEAHILTSLGPNTQQLILIGDHQQLRPKCSYELSVDKGDGFNLNRSLFERLVLKGFPHITLTQQHRMRPEISAMIRKLTYPDLTDAPSTLNRDNLRGFTNNIIFVDHREPEIELVKSIEMRDGKSSSKQNLFEAQMILKCVRYLAQQGYGSDKLVVLTPYLGQLTLLRDQLSKENDPILNDLDKFDLLRAGLLSDLSSKTSKPSLRISTIDNYQGEESDIVLASMTRSNKGNDIGFMAAPERLNVLLSRARNALIMIGNSETFRNARKGKEVWVKLFDHLTEQGSIYPGIPVECEKHPDRKAVLASPEDFESNCPDGGCKEPCGVILKCGTHKCPSSCHQLYDHSKIKCMKVLKESCDVGHVQTWHCHLPRPTVCRFCEREKKKAEEKVQKGLKEKLDREEMIRKHQLEVAKHDAEIEKIIQKTKDLCLDKEQSDILAQKRKDLENAKAQAARTTVSLQQPQKAPQVAAPAPQVTPASRKMSLTTPPANSGPPTTTTEGKTTLQDAIENCVDHNASPSMTEWQRQKDQENTSNPAIDKIMEMIGLEDVKSKVLTIKAKVETSIRQGTDLKKERLGLVLLGNPGTGKTTVARHYGKVLTSLNVLPGDEFVETTGSRLAHGGIAEAKKHLQQLENAEGGVYFIDEAYQLAEGHNYGGKTVLDFILAEIENLTGKVVFVFAGYRKQMEKFFEHNPGFRSRIPYTLNFEDYTDAELLKMLQFNMNKFYQGSMKIEDGPGGLYMRIAVRRLGRGRGRDGFGNARDLEIIFAKIRERQSDRLTKERRDGLSPDDHYITKEDLIGPDPSQAIVKCDAWTKLEQLTGLKSVKESVSFQIDLIKTNYTRELEEKPLIEVSLNRVFLGSPGTGKTSVGKLYGKILADLGLLSNGEVVVKNPADFIGSVIGESEKNTKGILDTTVGKVLIIDEAYMLHSGGNAGGGSNAADVYKTAVIDTIVAEIQSVPGEDRCVLLLGYEPQMIEMFQNVNPGLTRRFQPSDAFRFEDFDDSELEQILKLKLKDAVLGATPQAVNTAIQVLSRLRNGMNFGNGGDVQSLISKAKANYQTRQRGLPAEQRSTDFIFEPQDFDPDFDRAAGAETNLTELFKDVIGCESIVTKLNGFLRAAKGMRAQGIDPRGQIPMNFIFKGPPGTGKTITARKIGQVYYDLGFLSKVEVVECSATDLIGQYVGQTGPKTIKQLERGLGKVLFIDEAYRLGEGHFAQEAVNELVDTMTKPRFLGKMVIILAGYEHDMNRLLTANEGLGSRFGEEINFPALSPGNCLHVLESTLLKSKIAIPSMHEPEPRKIYLDLMSKLAGLKSWGNARDVQTLAKNMVGLVYQQIETKVDQLVVSEATALECMREMLVTRVKRKHISSETPRPGFGPVQQLGPGPQAPPNFSTSTAHKSKAEDPEGPEDAPAMVEGTNHDLRDLGVSDAIWEQLQIDKRNEERQAKIRKVKLAAEERRAKEAEMVEREAIAALQALREAQAKDEAEALELLKRREEARIKELWARAERERILGELEGRRKKEQDRKKKEQQMQVKLRQMGICPMGFQWIKQDGGYRCSAGGHFVSDGDLGM